MPSQARVIAIGAVVRLVLLLVVILASITIPARTYAVLAQPEKGAPPKWTRISPRQVSTNPAAFQNGNYGFGALAVDPKSGAVYVGTSYQGLWKSLNQGKTWTKVNTGTGGNVLDSGRATALVIDPTNPQIMYAAAIYGLGGVWKSTDGGKDWTNLLDASSTVAKAIPGVDVVSIAMDPVHHNHLIASFHGVTGRYANKGPVIETQDGGQSWSIHPINGGINYPEYVHFLNNSSSWLLSTTTRGLWRTTNAGARWAQVSGQSVADGANQIYRAKNGDWYVPSAGNLQRSADNGRTWKDVGPTGIVSQYMSVIGDGTHLYTQMAQGWYDKARKQHYYIASEKGGVRWAQYSAQTFSDGPSSMAYDSTRHIIYSSNWHAGVWKLHVR